MATNDFRWVRVRATGTTARGMSDFRLPSAAAAEGFADGDGHSVEIELPNLNEYATPIAKAHLLLDTAAEIEQSLMVQYLYAAYSLRDPNDQGLDEQQKKAVRSWARTIAGISKEEMGHLMTVQNLLLFIGQRPNLEREDFPPRKQLYPFQMHLEPLSQKSLAKYVVTESSNSAAGIEDIVALATGSAGMDINRVGILYAILGVLFTKLEDLDSNASSGDPWPVCIRNIAHMLYARFPGQPPEEWHLTDDKFDPGSATRQAPPDEWALGKIRVFKVENRQQCLDALKDISIQGEGVSMMDANAEASHFERFLKVYMGEGDLVPFPPEGDWNPTRSVPVDPFVDPDSSEANAISDPNTIKWAQMANLRYELLLGMLQQYFDASANDRPKIRNWCIDGGMLPMRDLSQKLVTLDRRTNAMLKAALPFTLPEVINLPTDPESRVALLRRRFMRSARLVDQLIAGGNADPVLSEIQSADEELLEALGGSMPIPDPGPKPETSVQELAMLELLKNRQPEARNRHAGIPTGNTNLRQLFRDENHDSILAFLKQGTAIRDPQTGKKLIEPGKPEESGFYLHISRDDGVMFGIFDASEIEVVRNWITSLAAGEMTTKPKSPDPGKAMLGLIAKKKVPGQVMHGAIETPDGETLSDLFRQEKFDDILAFLQSGEAIIYPFSGKQLIKPGVPEESAFYLHIMDPQGAMAGRFNPDEIAIVKRWIESLAPNAKPVPIRQFQAASVLVASGLDNPVFVTAPPGDDKRLFVVEQGGSIKIIKLGSGKVVTAPFLKLTDIRSGGERGLLGLAFHPDFANNKTFFVNCTNLQGATEIRSYRVSSGSADKADVTTKKLVLLIEQPFANHNGGWIAFGPRDGLLYLATGDGGSGNDPHGNSQNLNSLLGKMLRIDINGDDFPDDDKRTYAIPQSNPFVGRANARSEIWAFGLRNPWRCSFDRETGDLYIADVGQNKREELNFQPASSTGGENYGWNLREGTSDTGLGSVAGLTLVDPFHEYGRTDGFAVIGGYVYRGSGFAAMQGTCFFGDHRGRVWTLRHAPGKTTDLKDRSAELASDGNSLENLSTFGEDANGELYFATLAGDVFHITAEEVAVKDSRWNDVAKIRIHPAIGVARVGNAGFANGVAATPAQPEDFFIGPELPFAVSPPVGGYKRNGRIRRQAARFRVYAYDSNDELIGEVTSEQAEITWTVELANKKASFRRFTGLSANGSLRNGNVTGADRSKLEIKPGPRTITGPNQSASFADGSFTDWQASAARTVDQICLGEIQTEETGRLLVLAGEGIAKSPWNKPITGFVNNDGWYDTISDGPVRASIRFHKSARSFAATPAWVVAGPPKFAPALRNVITLYDVLFDVAVKNGWREIPAKPSFRNDIYPILERAISLQWILAPAGSRHSAVPDTFPPGSDDSRKALFARLRSPIPGENRPGMNMPQLFDDSNGWQRTGDEGLAFTTSMYEMLRRWSVGEFTDDWSGVPPEVPSQVTPEGLDRAALENCSGGGFYPGMEVSWMVRDTLDYLEPFRLNTAGLEAGDVSRQMAVPWQADFRDCTHADSDGRQVGWWPQQRPDEVFVEGSTTQVAWTRNKVASRMDMVSRWHELGFVLDNGTRFVETDRTPDPPGPV